EQQQHSVTDGGGLSALLERSFIGMCEVASTVLVWERDGLHRFYLRRYRVLQD
ncbi:unnamed protein product, partial [Ascophyllum nodosum]